MAVTKREEVLKEIADSLTAKQSDANPFVRENDTMFMRYDEICVTPQMPGPVTVEFRWRGAAMYSMRVDCDFAAGQLLTLRGVEGRIETRIL